VVDIVNTVFSHANLSVKFKHVFMSTFKIRLDFSAILLINLSLTFCGHINDGFNIHNPWKFFPKISFTRVVCKSLRVRSKDELFQGSIKLSCCF
jgi:hypothetical protein